MAARTLRRIFTSPFVITLAAAPAVLACSSKKEPAQPPTRNPPAPDPQEPPVVPQEIPTTNPPAPTTPSNPPPPKKPPPDPAKTRPSPGNPYRWTVTRSGAVCHAIAHVACPKPAGNEPAPTCNPPPPVTFDCPPGLADKASLIIAQYQPDTPCTVERPPMTCPKGATCNPPAPQRVACPAP